MNKCYEYQTLIGHFYIVKHEDRYHAVYAGTSILSCTRPEEIAAVLGYGYKFNLLGAEICEIDTSNLGIPTDISNWTHCYFMPFKIRGNFLHNSWT